MAIFITGATGYIGGALADRFVAAGREVRGLVRSPDKAAELAARGIAPVLGSLDDAALLADESITAEAVINAANSDHRGAVLALMDGLAGSGKPFLHTSGTGILVEDTEGEMSRYVYDDDTPFAPNPMLADRAEIDQLVMDSASRGIRSVVLCNSLIYGHGRGLHRDSVMVPWLMRQAREDGRARYIGAGEAIWSHVHLEDMLDLYELAIAGAPPGSRYFVENGESSFKDLAQAVAHRFGLGRATSWKADEAAAHAGDMYAMIFGSACRVRATRARSELGWRPTLSSLPGWIMQEG